MKKIKSIADVITNSSDETYIIKSPLTAIEVEHRFDEFMRANHPEDWDQNPHFRGGETYYPDSYEDTPEGVVVSWDVMCNLDDAEGYLKECFPEAKVEDYYPGRWRG